MKNTYLVYVKKLDKKEIDRLEEEECMKKAEKERKKEAKRKRKKSKKNIRIRYKRESGSGYKLLLCGVMGLSTLIICAMLFMNYKICFQGDSTTIGESKTEQQESINEQQGLTAEQKVESTFIATGLTMIGLAISVWAGLNIVQVLEKGKIEALDREVEEYRRERCELNKRNFFNNILQLDDILNKHLYKMFSEIEDKSDNKLAAFYFECDKIETKFQNVYVKQKAITRNIPVQYYEDAIDETNRLLEEVCSGDYKDADKFVKYLKVRLAEFNFYLGYNVGADSAINCFQQVIEYFYEVFEELKAPKMIMEKRYYLDGDKELTLYMFNTLGEAYSKILQGYIIAKEKIENFDKIAEMVELFYGCAIELIEKRQVNSKAGFEVYYRNYGAALERINKYRCNGKDSFEDAELFQKIKGLYQKAIDDVVYGNREKLREQTFQVYVSLYFKYIKYLNVMEYMKGDIAKLNLIQNSIEDLEQYTRSVDFYASLAITMSPLNLYFWKIKAFAERDYIVWAIAKGDTESAKKHYEQFKKWWERIEQSETRNEKNDPMDVEVKEATTLFDIHFNRGKEESATPGGTNIDPT